MKGQFIRIGSTRGRVFNRDYNNGFHMLHQPNAAAYCQPCDTKDARIDQLEGQVAQMSQAIETLQLQREQPEKALRYLF